MNRPRDIAAHPYLRRSAGLVEGTARLLGGGLELLHGEAAPLCARCRPAACAACAREEAALYRECRNTRRTRARTARGARARWTCPRGVHLAAWPVGSPVERPAVLLSLLPRRQSRAAGFLRDLARHLGEELRLVGEMTELSAELASKYDELGMLYAVAGRLNSAEGLAPALRELMEKALATQEADAALLAIPSRHLREVILRPGLRLPAPARPLWSAFERSLQARLREDGNGCYLGSAWTAQDEPSPFGRPAQFVAVRLRHEANDGLFCLLHLDPERAFRASDMKLLESLAEQIRLAVANAELYEDLRRFLMATVKSLVGAIEEKDPYTSGHSERVNLVSMLIGKRIGLSTAEMETLRWASILHDVGKIGMPEAILRKPGRLTPAEFRTIQEHPERGYRLLRPIAQLEEAAACVLAHHERIDGRGYPRGLPAAEIPFLARIIAVADTFDALTSTRSYRTARTIDFASDEIRRVRGTQLDQEVVDAFLELVPFLREHQVMIEGTLRTEDPSEPLKEAA